MLGLPPSDKKLLPFVRLRTSTQELELTGFQMKNCLIDKMLDSVCAVEIRTTLYTNVTNFLPNFLHKLLLQTHCLSSLKKLEREAWMNQKKSNPCTKLCIEGKT